MERRLARRLCVLAPVLLAAAGVAAGSAFALLPHQSSQRRLALLGHERSQRRLALLLHRRSQRRLALRLAADRAAPSLWLSGVTLHWTATATSHLYVESRTTGATITYVHVSATTDTPPVLAGATVTYKVRPRYRPNAWSNQVEVTYPGSGGKREHQREQREREQREAKERAEREAKERAEREAKETAEREQREREEREKGTTGGAVALSAPPGVPAPSSGWHVAYADAFGAPLGSGPGQDNTVVSSEKWNGCCTNSNEVAVEQHSQVRVGAAGLEEVCSLGSFTVEGHTRGASCGGVRSDGFFEFAPASAGEWAVECYVRMPVDAGGADPGCWTYPSESGEIDFFELWGWNGVSWATANGGMPAVVGQGEHELSPVDSLGFDPSLAFHRYTTAFVPEGSGRYDVREYIDGAFRWDLPGRALSSAYDGLILTNGLRLRVQADALTVRSIELYQDGAHAGQGVRGGGIAPGTTVK